TVRLALSQPPEGRVLVAEGLQEGERKLRCVERPLGERRYGLFNLYGVHTAPSQPPIGELFPCRCVKSDTVEDRAAYGCTRQDARAPSAEGSSSQPSCTSAESRTRPTYKAACSL